MSMSTKIKDLPGPIPVNNVNIQNQNVEIGNSVENLNTINFEQEAFNQENFNIIENKQNVYMDIKKVENKEEIKEEFKEEFKDKENLFSLLQSQINEENLLLFVFLILSSRKELDNYIHVIPYIGSHLSNTNNFTLTIVKCVFILLLYIVIKIFVLPKIKI